MKNLNRSSAITGARGTLLATALAFGMGPTFAAADSDFDIDVIASAAAKQASVTLSTADLKSVLGYTVTLTHYNPRGGEMLTRVGFSVTTSVSGGLGQVATFQDVPANCVASLDLSMLSCQNMGTLTPTAASLSFVLTAKAPTVGDKVTLTITSVSYTEVEPPPAHDHAETVVTAVVAATTLKPPDPLNFSTYVPPSGAIFYTGTNGGLPQSTLNNTWTATVKVPLGGTTGGTTGSIVNTIGDPACPRAANLLDCSSSAIGLPDYSSTTKLLTFVLRRDASTIVRNGKIGSAIVYYNEPAHPDPRINYDGYGFQVSPCSSTTYGTLPQSGIPCIQSRNAVYKHKDGDLKSPRDGLAGKDDGEDSGKLLYWEFIIKAVDNGRFTN